MSEVDSNQSLNEGSYSWYELSNQGDRDGIQCFSRRSGSVKYGLLALGIPE